ncbi:MAG: crossover junction endodeoxyribonuclease RuvC [Bacteroidales bacterium]|nr:crossover junction endodeoxyribonuclease RuvC [Bacteroidales bacterium]
MANNDKIILGIDPGTLIMGYGLICLQATKTSLITLGVIELRKYPDHFERLQHIFSRVDMLIREFKPQELAIEAPFYGKNVQSMLKLGRAQGIAMAAALSHQMKVFEYSPRKIKQSLTGNGNASKEQVAAMIQKILHFEDMPKYLDATDALAVAVCHSYQNLLSDNEKKPRSWKDFIQKNKDRLA